MLFIRTKSYKSFDNFIVIITASPPKGGLPVKGFYVCPLRTPTCPSREAARDSYLMTYFRTGTYLCDYRASFAPLLVVF